MDLDNFKDINDTYGHHVGDRALREVAGVLRAAIRPYDICVRYAGDEFIVVLSGCGGEEAERKRLELQRAVDGLQFEARPGQDAAAGDQRRRGGVPARRRQLRNAAGDRRQPHVPRQDAAQAARLPAATTRRGLRPPICRTSTSRKRPSESCQFFRYSTQSGRAPTSPVQISAMPVAPATSASPRPTTRRISR